MGVLTSAGGTTLTGPFVVASGAGANATSAKNASANRQFEIKPAGNVNIPGAVQVTGILSSTSLHAGPTVAFNVLTSTNQSAPNFAEASGFSKWLAVTVSGGQVCIPAVSGTIAD